MGKACAGSTFFSPGGGPPAMGVTTSGGGVGQESGRKRLPRKQVLPRSPYTSWNAEKHARNGFRWGSRSSGEPFKTMSKILLVDEDERSRTKVQGFLRTKGFEVVAAERGQEGLGAFERERPDAVVLSRSLPDVDGYAVCRALR